MQNLVKVTRRGQTTIPAELRQKPEIKEGDELLVEGNSEKPIRFGFLASIICWFLADLGADRVLSACARAS